MISKEENKEIGSNILSDKSDDTPIWENGKKLFSINIDSFKNSIKEANNNNLDKYLLNDLNGSQWTIHSKSVQIFNGPITAKRKEHGAAFPITLAKHFINIYSKPKDLVLDPFAGVGTTLDAANISQRNSIGIELNKNFIKLFNRGLDPKDGLFNPDYRRIIIQDTSLNIQKYLPNNSADFILTSPPYSNLLNNIRDNFADKD